MAASFNKCQRPFLLAAISAILFCTPAFSGPFGFSRGMTKEQIVAQVGKSAIVSEKPDATGGTFLVLSTAPKPYSEFEKYSLIISPTEGLLKIVAIGKDISTAAAGEQLRSHFDSLHAILVASYQAPTNDFSYLKADSIWSDDKDFTMALIKKDRTLESFWLLEKGASLTNDVTVIDLEAKASTQDVGYILLAYEFKGWEQYVEKRDAKEGSVL